MDRYGPYRLAATHMRKQRTYHYVFLQQHFGLNETVSPFFNLCTYSNIFGPRLAYSAFRLYNFLIFNYNFYSLLVFLALPPAHF